MEPNPNAVPRDTTSLPASPSPPDESAGRPAGVRLEQLCEAILQVFRQESSPATATLLDPGKVVRSVVERELVPRLEEGLRSVAVNLRQEMTAWLHNIEELERLSGLAADCSAQPSAGARDEEREVDSSPANATAVGEASTPRTAPPESTASANLSGEPKEEVVPENDAAPKIADGKETTDAHSAIAIAAPPAVLPPETGLQLLAEGEDAAGPSDVVETPPSLPPSVQYFQRAQAHLQQREYDQAIAAYTQAIRLDPEFADAFLGRGRANRGKGDLDGALADFTHVLQFRPQDANALNNRGNVHASQGRTAQAVADYSAALQIDPSLAAAHVNRALVFAKEGRFEEALADAEAAVDLDSDFGDSYFVLGLAHAGLGDHEAAIADFTRFLHFTPTSPLVYNNRGLSHGKMGDYKAAAADYTAALRLNPRLVSVRYNRAVAFRCLGNLEQAASDLDTILRLAPDHALAHYQRGLVNEERNEPEQALADFSRAAELAPHLEDATARRDRLARGPSPTQHEEDEPIPFAATEATVERTATAVTAREVKAPPPSAETPPPMPTVPPKPPKPEQAKRRPEEAATKHGLLRLACPECGASTQVSFDRLSNQFLCRACHRLYRVHSSGTLTELRPTRSRNNERLADLRSKALRVLTAVVLVVALLFGGWYGWQRIRRKSLPPLPLELEARAEMMAKAWTNGDTILVRRLTLSSHGQKLRRWLNENRSPLPSEELNRSRNALQTQVEVRVLQQTTDGAQLAVQVSHPLSKPARIMQFWVKEGDGWFFAPLEETDAGMDRKARRRR